MEVTSTRSFRIATKISDTKDLTVKEVYTKKSDKDSVYLGTKRADDLAKDSTFTVTEYIKGGKHVEKVIKKEKGAWNWQTTPSGQ